MATASVIQVSDSEPKMFTWNNVPDKYNGNLYEIVVITDSEKTARKNLLAMFDYSGRLANLPTEPEYEAAPEGWHSLSSKEQLAYDRKYNEQRKKYDDDLTEAVRKIGVQYPQGSSAMVICDMCVDDNIIRKMCPSVRKYTTNTWSTTSPTCSIIITATRRHIVNQ